MKCPFCLKEIPVGDLEGFEQFWKLYPRKIAKGKARKVWKQLNPDKQTRQMIMMAVKKQKEPGGRLENRLDTGLMYCPHPATWLEDESFCDEVPEKPAGKHFDSDAAENNRRMRENLRKNSSGSLSK